MAGRAAWPKSGAGGTLSADGSKPGPYYALATGKSVTVGRPGWKSQDPNERAVRGAVLAIQRSLNRRLPRDAEVVVDGLFGEQTKAAVVAFQTVNKQVGPADGVVGVRTAKVLFTYDLKNRCAARDFDDWEVVCGIVQNESGWDPGAVGYTDPDDLGLAQINGDAHPDMSEQERLRPMVAFDFVIDYLTASLEEFEGNIRDAIASYNLGRGGARAWIRAGRPDVWTPAGSSTPRNVEAYIDRIISACAGI